MDSLQFQKVEIEDTRPKCGACRAPMEGSYFQLAGGNICEKCAGVVRNRQAKPPMNELVRGGLYGLGAAVGCAIVYALVTWMTGMSLALLSIAVGYLVGRAVRMGTRGMGGLRCQIMAVGLTYFAITMSYAPFLIKGMRDAAMKETPEKKAAREASAAKLSSIPRPLQLAIGIGTIAAISLAAPFLDLAGGASGIIGLIIVAVGLMQAWKLTARDKRLLSGPFELPSPSEAPAIG